MKIIDGKKVKLQLLDELKKKVNNLKDKIGLAIIQIGSDDASQVYVNNKKKLALELGYFLRHIHLEDNVKEKDILLIIDELNKDDKIDGILLQLPIPKNLNVKRLQNAISPLKDVDGLSDLNMGSLVHNNESLIACTPLGIMDLLKYYKINVKHKCVVIAGRSDLVGKPLAQLMLNNDATVIMCHSKTKDLEKFTNLADILVVAIGKAQMINSKYVKDGAVIIDVGINRTSNGIVGDVDFLDVKDKVSFITPVPGGVGPMTVMELAINTYKAHLLRKGDYYKKR